VNESKKFKNHWLAKVVMNAWSQYLFE